MGLFYAPSVVANAVKVSCFASALLQELGFQVYPQYDEYRTDIIAAVALGDEEKMIAFCQGIQKGSPIDAYVTPEPWAMPGYDSEVIMAAGAFTMGASIELSAGRPAEGPLCCLAAGRAYLQHREKLGAVGGPVHARKGLDTPIIAKSTKNGEGSLSVFCIRKRWQTLPKRGFHGMINKYENRRKTANYREERSLWPQKI